MLHMLLTTSSNKKDRLGKSGVEPMWETHTINWQIIRDIVYWVFSINMHKIILGSVVPSATTWTSVSLLFIKPTLHWRFQNGEKFHRGPLCNPATVFSFQHQSCQGYLQARHTSWCLEEPVESNMLGPQVHWGESTMASEWCKTISMQQYAQTQYVYQCFPWWKLIIDLTANMSCAKQLHVKELVSYSSCRFLATVHPSNSLATHSIPPTLTH